MFSASIVCPITNGQCDCVIVKVLQPISSDTSNDLDDVYHFRWYQASPFLVRHKELKGKTPLIVDTCSFTRDVVDILLWYLEPLAPSPSFSSPSLPPLSSSSSYLSSCSSTPSLSSSSLSPHRTTKELLTEVYARANRGLFSIGELVLKLIDAANVLEMKELVAYLSRYIVAALETPESSVGVRDRLHLMSDLQLSDEEKEQEKYVWKKNEEALSENVRMVGDICDSSISSAQIAMDSIRRKPIAISDSSTEKCMWKDCSVYFNMFYGRHHCRRCGQIFCSAHASHYVRLQPHDQVKVNVGWFSDWYTVVMNYGDTSLQRICDDCFANLQSEMRSQSAFQAFLIIGLEIKLLYRALFVTKAWREASQKCMNLMSHLQYKFQDEPFNEYERNLLWNNRYYWTGHPRWLLQLVRIADLSNEAESQEVINILQSEKRLVSCRKTMCDCLNFTKYGKLAVHRVRHCDQGFTPFDLLQFLNPAVRHPGIREFAANQFLKKSTPSEMQLLLPLLVHYLRDEPFPAPSPLFGTLLKLALSHVPSRFDLYWSLSFVAHGGGPNASRYDYYLQRLVLEVTAAEGRQAGSDFTDLYSFYLSVRTVPSANDVGDDEAKRRLAAALKTFQNRSLPCPFDPTHRVLSFDVDKLKISESKVRPIHIPMSLECVDSCRHGCHFFKSKPKKSERKMTHEKDDVHMDEKRRFTRKIIYKKEDLRRDYLVLNIVRVMDLLVTKYIPSLNCERVTYRVIPTSTNDGFIECVEDAYNLSDANQEEGGEDRTLTNWLIVHNPKDIMAARDMYIKTMAFWSVATLLLGVGDRHACNIMVRPNGALFHIDYGFILGEDPKPFVPYVRLTSDMVEAMGGKGSPNYSGLFLESCVKIYLLLREHSQLFMEMCSVLFSWEPPFGGVLPDMAYKQRVLEQLHARFNTRLESVEAEIKLRQWIEESYKNPLLGIIDQYRKNTLPQDVVSLCSTISSTPVGSVASGSQRSSSWTSIGTWFSYPQPPTQKDLK